MAPAGGSAPVCSCADDGAQGNVRAPHPAPLPQPPSLVGQVLGPFLLPAYLEEKDQGIREQAGTLPGPTGELLLHAGLSLVFPTWSQSHRGQETALVIYELCGGGGKRFCR